MAHALLHSRCPLWATDVVVVTAEEDAVFMKNLPTNLVVEHDFHPETIEQLASLRDIRLGLAKKQLANVDATLNELINRGLIECKDMAAMKVELESELLDRIKNLEKRSDTVTSNDVYFDELSLYVDLI